jgi:RNA polymerase sigma factor for flagellar operon FliA
MNSNTLTDSQSDTKRLELFNGLTGMVVAIVDRIAMNLPSHVVRSNKDDFIMVGFETLWKATESYAEERDETFVSYAAMRIRGAILDELRRMDFMPRRIRARVRRASEQQAELRQTTGSEVSLTAAAQSLGMTRGDVREITLHTKVTFINLDQIIEGEEGNGSTAAELIADPSAIDPAAEILSDDMHKLLEDALGKLDRIERSVIRLYYFNGIPMADLGACLGLTESRICQVNAVALVKLRRLLSKKR